MLAVPDQNNSVKQVIKKKYVKHNYYCQCAADQ
jgi:hypothetical protein